MKEKFLEIYKGSIKREGADQMLQYLEATDFFTAPASTRFHGSFEGGLVAHSVNVYNELCRLLKAYNKFDIPVTKESAAVISLLHDVCKAGCYKTEMRNVKRDGQWFQEPFYTFKEDFPFGGHGSKSLFIIQSHMALTDDEAVAINCHMGPWDRSPGDYSLGNAYERYPLAFLLHMADEAATYIIEREEH